MKSIEEEKLVSFKTLEQKIFVYVCEPGREITRIMLEGYDAELAEGRDKKRYGIREGGQAQGNEGIHDERGINSEEKDNFNQYSCGGNSDSSSFFPDAAMDCDIFVWRVRD